MIIYYRVKLFRMSMRAEYNNINNYYCHAEKFRVKEEFRGDYYSYSEINILFSMRRII